MRHIIEVNNLKVDYRRGKNQTKLIHGIDLMIPEGKITGIVGESGSGKSISMKAIMNILSHRFEVSFDSFQFDGKDAHLSQNKVGLLPISMIFQDPMTSLNPLRTIGFHLTEVIKRHQNLPQSEAKKKGIAQLDQVGISSPELRFRQFPHELSGGMRQRVMIAMALLSKPQILIADEPTTALDVTVQAQILKLIKEQQIHNKLTVILVSHDFGVIAQMCDYVKVMLNGKIVEEGNVEDIFYHAEHEYTQELLKAIPSIHKTGRLYNMTPMRLSQAEISNGQMRVVQNDHRVLEVR